MEKRISKLKIALMQALGLESILISDPVDIYYLSGMRSSNCMLLLLPQEHLLFTDSRYTLKAKKVAKDFTVCEQNSDLFQCVRDALKKYAVRHLAIQDKHLTLQEYLRLSDGMEQGFVPAGDLLMDIRSVKEPEELDKIRQAQQLTDYAFEALLPFIREGVTEKSLAMELEFILKRNGAEALSFDTIIASGENGAMPHAVPSERKVRRGDLITMDFGCVYQGYCSDMTRTVAFGQPSEKLKNVYDTVLQAHCMAKEMLCSGISTQTIDAVARDYIAQCGYGEYFGHGLGHGVGLEIHELPLLSYRGNSILQSGQVVTVEPGIYLPGIGGVRVENMCFITETGYEDITASDKNLIIL